MLVRARPGGNGAFWTARFLKTAESVVLTTSERLQSELEQRLVAESRFGALGSTVAQQLVLAIDFARAPFVPKEPKVSKKPVRDERQIELKWWESSSGTLRSPDMTPNATGKENNPPEGRSRARDGDTSDAAAGDGSDSDKTLPQQAEKKRTMKPQANPPKSKEVRSLRARRQAPALTVFEYDMLTAREVIAKAATMSEHERATFSAHEQAHKKRTSVLRALGRDTAP